MCLSNETYFPQDQVSAMAAQVDTEQLINENEDVESGEEQEVVCRGI